MMRNKILEYAKSQELTVKGTVGDVYSISFNAKPNFLVEIKVVCSVHWCRPLNPTGPRPNEWFISVKAKDDSKELYSDWNEDYDDEEMEEDVINTIKALNNAHIRVSQTCLFKLFKWRFFKRKILEVKTDAGWVDFWELTYSTLK